MSGRFPVELFKAKLTEQAVKVGLSVDLIDFDAHVDSTLSWRENLEVFHRAYPQLGEVQTVKLERSYKREYNDFVKGGKVGSLHKSAHRMARQGISTVPSHPSIHGLESFRKLWRDRTRFLHWALLAFSVAFIACVIL
jgi:hypothetical protein